MTLLSQVRADPEVVKAMRDIGASQFDDLDRALISATVRVLAQRVREKADAFEPNHNDPIWFWEAADFLETLLETDR